VSGPKSYKDAGVDIAAMDAALAGVKRQIRATFTPAVLGDVGQFGGCFRMPGMRDGVLVSSIDGVGTKTRVAARTGRWEGIGRDIVGHCLNDIAVQGARPLFFLDYVGTDRLSADAFAQVVGGIAEACREHGVVLIGGETAEMPGVYGGGEMDVVGCVVGAVERDAIRSGAGIQPGDALVGLASSGLHTNGYTLARAVLLPEAGDEDRFEEPLGRTRGEALLEPHRCYARSLLALYDELGDRALGAAHITGGGIPGNLVRILPEGCRARVPSGWRVPPVFPLIQRLGGISDVEMRRAFNLGVGLIVCVRPAALDRAIALLEQHGETAFPLGEVVAGERGVDVA
jgi:phosphoribosylformylglycinamidine cyclo-ligase